MPQKIKKFIRQTLSLFFKTDKNRKAKGKKGRYANPTLQKQAHPHYNCPLSTMRTTRSVKKSSPSGSYFFVRLCPKQKAMA